MGTMTDTDPDTAALGSAPQAALTLLIIKILIIFLFFKRYFTSCESTTKESVDMHNVYV